MLPAVVLFISTTSGHFEWLSVTTRNIFLFFSSKSTRTLCQGRVAQGHGMRGVTVGTFHCLEHSGQLRTTSSMSLSIHDHHTNLRAMAFFLTIPGCMACNSWSNCPVYVDGMTTLLPDMMHPSSRESSSF